jgi:hypothetical protein
LINYPVAEEGTGVDMCDRGFYITAYPGTTLAHVTLYLAASTTEAYTAQLEAHDSTFDGALIGTATASFSGCTTTSVPADVKTTTFDFGDVAVTPGHVVAFKLTKVSGSGSVYFATNGVLGGATSIIRETEGTDAPLSSWRRSFMAIKVTGQD